MEDSEIVILFFARNENAILESERKYGKLCRSVAERILSSAEDTEECVSDTWLKAWNVIPPDKPARLGAFFAKITRNLALDRWRSAHTKKKGGGIADLCLEELQNSITSSADPIDRLLLRDLLNRFLRELKPEPREIFLLRYWYFFSNADIAQRTGKSLAAVKISLHRTREELRKYLEKEGVDL
jgi:RNA polymerase sigma-70 factor (ECF subfamily)